MIKRMETAVAVVIGQGGYNDLGMIRSCGEAGMTVVYCSPNDLVVPVYKSKYVFEWIPTDVRIEKSVMHTLENIKTKYTGLKIGLFPTSDALALLMDKNYYDLEKSFRMPHANGHLNILMDKGKMTMIAQMVGMKVPVSQNFNLQEECDVKFPLPCIVKPLKSVNGEKEDIAICRSQNTLNNTISRYIEKGTKEVLIQKLIEGENLREVAVTGVALPDGKIETHGIINKIRIRGNGSTVFAKYSNHVESDLQDKVKQFIKASNYQGIFDMEFLKNDFGYHFIECNYRNGAYGYAVTKAGFNMPAVFMGLRHSENGTAKIESKVFMEERSDLLNVLDNTISCRRWIGDLIKTDTFLWWNFRDPQPLIRVPHFIKKLFH